MRELADKALKTVIISVVHPYVQDRGKHEHAKDRHGRYKNRSYSNYQR